MRTRPGIQPDGAGALFVVDADGGRPTRITPWGASFLDNDWSPDGEWIVFQRPYGQLFLVHPDGSGMHRIPIDLPRGAGARMASWSPDGEWIVFSMQQGSRGDDLGRPAGRLRPQAGDHVPRGGPDPVGLVDLTARFLSAGSQQSERLFHVRSSSLGPCARELALADLGPDLRKGVLVQCPFGRLHLVLQHLTQGLRRSEQPGRRDGVPPGRPRPLPTPRGNRLGADGPRRRPRWRSHP